MPVFYTLSHSSKDVFVVADFTQRLFKSGYESGALLHTVASTCSTHVRHVENLLYIHVHCRYRACVPVKAKIQPLALEGKGNKKNEVFFDCLCFSLSDPTSARLERERERECHATRP